MITSNGKLTPNFEYIAKLREEKELQMNTMMKKKEANKVEIGATESVMHENVGIVAKEKIKPEVLDFGADNWEK